MAIPSSSRFLFLLLPLCYLSACSSGEGVSSSFFDPANPLGLYAKKSPSVEEELPGGNTTSKFASGGDSFGAVIPSLSSKQKGDFQAGNSLFRDPWNAPLTSTNDRDGLGPFFNANSCGACHKFDGRSPLPSVAPKYRFDKKGKPLHYLMCNGLGGMLFRISIPYKDPKHPTIELSQPDPVYGDQLEPQATTPMLRGGEAEQCLYWSVMSKNDFGGQYVVKLKKKDGSFKTVYLARPEPIIKNWNYGDPLKRVNTVYVSPRIGPQVIGMGLLESIPIEQLQDLADPDDLDGDGISGRLMIIPDFVDMEGHHHYNVAGRFGWKAEQPTVSGQTAGAFLGDMGLTTPLHMVNNCPDPIVAPEFYKECNIAAYPGLAGTPEVRDPSFRLIVSYTSTLAVPRRRNFYKDNIMRGWKLFRSVGCDSCHHPSFTTKQSTLTPVTKNLVNMYGKPIFDNVKIYPYTDLLVHDMGPGLCDGRPPFTPDAAGSCEWRTPPLWGVGLIPKVNNHQQLLHDGRATGVEEAILWHGGEAQRQKENYTKLSEDDRDALVAFVNSL